MIKISDLRLEEGVARGCAAPVLLLVFSSSNGPVILRLKFKSAFVLFVYVIFWVALGANESLGIDQYLKFK